MVSVRFPSRGMLVLLPLLLVLPGCQRERRGLTSPTSHTAAQRVGMITEARAIDIAKKDLAVNNMTKALESEPITVELKGDRYLVTFGDRRSIPPTVFGGSYDARVVIEAKTGEVIGIMISD